MQLRSGTSSDRPTVYVAKDAVHTEDGILVYNIKIEKMPGNATREAIYRHFTKYGKIKHIEISRGKTRSKPKSCNIYFHTANSATAALKNDYKQFYGSHIKVKACPSWEQPFGMNAVSTESKNGSGGANTLLSLNDYCLEMVFRQLDLLEQVRLSLCHVRLEHIFVYMICPLRTHNLVLSELQEFSLWEMRQFFRTAGKLLRSIEMPEECNILQLTRFKAHVTLYDLIADNCLNVQRLQVVRRSFIYINFLNVLQPRNITELELYDCNLNEDNLCNICKELLNLQALSLACNSGIRGGKLSHLIKLQYLSLYKCNSISEDTLMNTCRALKLRYLDVRGISCTLQGSVLAACCSELETLRVTNYKSAYLNGIERLPKLKYLHIQYLYEAMPVIFYNSLAQEHADDLVELKIYGNVYSMYPTVASYITRFKKLRVLWLHGNANNISKGNLKLFATLSELEEINIDTAENATGDNLLPLIERCTKLKRMSLRFCWQIKNTFVRKVIAILEKRAKPPKTPLFILLYRTCVVSQFLCSHTYKNARHLVRISFENPKPLQGFINEKSIFDFEKFYDTEYSFEDDNNSATDSDYDDMVEYHSDNDFNANQYDESDEENYLYGSSSSNSQSDESINSDIFFMM